MIKSFGRTPKVNNVKVIKKVGKPASQVRPRSAPSRIQKTPSQIQRARKRTNLEKAQQNISANTVILALNYDKCISQFYKEWGSTGAQNAMLNAFIKKIKSLKKDNQKYIIVGFSGRQSKLLCNAHTPNSQQFKKNFAHLHARLNKNGLIYPIHLNYLTNNSLLYPAKNTNEIKNKNRKIENMKTAGVPKSKQKALGDYNKSIIAHQIKHLFPQHKVLFVDDKLEKLQQAKSVYGNKAHYLLMDPGKAYMETMTRRKNVNYYVKQYTNQ